VLAGPRSKELRSRVEHTHTGDFSQFGALFIEHNNSCDASDVGGRLTNIRTYAAIDGRLYQTDKGDAPYPSTYLQIRWHAPSGCQARSWARRRASAEGREELLKHAQPSLH
jgi:hypothetical protein